MTEQHSPRKAFGVKEKHAEVKEALLLMSLAATTARHRLTDSHARRSTTSSSLQEDNPGLRAEAFP